MTQTHTSYEFSKRLKEFLGESAPKPLGGNRDYYCDGCGTHGSFVLKPTAIACCPDNHYVVPSYSLHDLLSKPFAELMAEKTKDYSHGWNNTLNTTGRLYKAYYHGGMEAVEKALTEMMEDIK